MRRLKSHNGDPLDLLLASPLADPGPYFIEQTIALCIKEGQKSPQISSLGPKIGLALFAVCICVTAGILGPPKSVAVKTVAQPAVSQAFVVVATYEANTDNESEDQSPM